MRALVVDTNVLLSEIEKLVKFISETRLKVYIPMAVYDEMEEFYRIARRNENSGYGGKDSPVHNLILKSYPVFKESLYKGLFEVDGTRGTGLVGRLEYKPWASKIQINDIRILAVCLNLQIRGVRILLVTKDGGLRKVAKKYHLRLVEIYDSQTKEGHRVKKIDWQNLKKAVGF